MTPYLSINAFMTFFYTIIYVRHPHRHSGLWNMYATIDNGDDKK
jgi:hypothetical protein